MKDETVGKLIRTLGMILMNPYLRSHMNCAFLEQCKADFLEAVNQLPEEGKRLLLLAAKQSGLIDPNCFHTKEGTV